MVNFEVEFMSDWKMFRLKEQDAERIDELVKTINVKMEKQGMKPVRPGIVLRALIFQGLETETDELIKAINKARMYE